MNKCKTNDCIRFILVLLPLFFFLLRCQSEEKVQQPNFIVMFADDLGYADIGCFGSKDIETPNLDKMAEEGIRFTDFYVASPVCSPSRAALMTGCYPQRVGIPEVLFPEADFEWSTPDRTKRGLNPDETTIAKMLKAKGYATGCFGKWHLGHHPEFLPRQHGFDTFFGLPYSNDMWPKNHPGFPPLPLYDGDEVIKVDPDQTNLTTWYTEHAIQFIEKNKNRPFFAYIPHSMPHVPLFVSDKFKGKSKRGLYGDVISEIDWSMGQILETLKKHKLDENTFVLFTSDNGPWLSYGDHAGSAQPLREGKLTTFDGGQRVPCIMRWPGKIPAGRVCREMATTMDMLPTFARLADAALPVKKFDGKDIWPLVSSQSNAKSPHEVFYFYRSSTLQALRSGKWKLHLPHEYGTVKKVGKDGANGKMRQVPIELSLFDLENDVSEENNVADQYPQIVERLLKYAEAAKKELGHEDRKGFGQREPGWAK